MPSLLLNFSLHSETLDKRSILYILKKVPKDIPLELWNTIRDIIIDGMNSPTLSVWPYVFLLAKEIHLRRKYSNSIPLLVDLPTLFNSDFVPLLLDILNELAKYDQVILFLKEEGKIQESIDEYQVLYTLPNKISTQKHYLFGDSNLILFPQ